MSIRLSLALAMLPRGYQIVPTYRTERCPRGHDNWYLRPDGSRRCKTCRNRNQRRRRREGVSY